MTVVPICLKCAHLYRARGGKSDWTCTAYPTGIPEEILVMKVDHRKPYRGDHGIRFEPKKD